MPTKAHWTGLPQFKAALERMATRASAEARAGVAEAAALLEKTAKENASGAPGPEVITGTLRRSIRHTPIEPWGVMGWQTEVGPTAIYGRRVELGFSGPDVLGRVFDQRPRPYFEPAVEHVRGQIREIYSRHMRRAIVH